jgi:hypothetical protein
MRCGKLVNFARAILHIVQHQTATIATKTICKNDIRTGIDKALMQRCDALGLFNVPDLWRFACDKSHFEKIGPGRTIGDKRFTGGKERGE